MNEYIPTDRRPVSSRDLSIIKKLAAFLAAKQVSANTISVLGAVSACLAAICFVATNQAELPRWLLWVAGAVFIQGRLLANVLDGMVAIAQGKASAVGELFNEIPDRISDSVILIGLGYSAAGSPAWGYLAAITAMFTAYIRAVGKGAGTQQQFCGPMAKQHRMFLATIAVLLTAAFPAFTLCMGGICRYGFVEIALVIIAIGSLDTSWRRLSKIARELRT